MSPDLLDLSIKDINVRAQLCLVALGILEGPKTEQELIAEVLESEVLWISQVLDSAPSYLRKSNLAFPFLLGAIHYTRNFRLRNLANANGQIVTVDTSQKKNIIVDNPDKQKININNLEVAKAAKFWEPESKSEYQFRDNALKGVVYHDSKFTIANLEVLAKTWCGIASSGNHKGASVKAELLRDRLVQMFWQFVEEWIRKIDLRLPEANQQPIEKEYVAKFNVNEEKFTGGNGSHVPRFLIFTGPPGTGKTRQAKEICKGSVTEIVQVHPSFGYEDLVEGIKPVIFIDGELKYEVVDGPVRVLARKASGIPLHILVKIESFKNDSEVIRIRVHLPLGTQSRYELSKVRVSTSANRAPAGIDGILWPVNFDWFEVHQDQDEQLFAELLPHVNSFSKIYLRGVSILRNHEECEWGASLSYSLVLDEINRGHVAAMLGELIFAISEAGAPEEERKSVRLQYSNEQFMWPRNLDLIGTMNSADISTDKIDQAIKRRFDFIDVLPLRKEELHKIVLKELDRRSISEFFEQNKVESKFWPGAILDDINDTLRDQAPKYGAFNVKDKLIGHSYMIKYACMINEKLTEKGPMSLELVISVLRDIVEHEIFPVLLNMFNGDRRNCERFILERIVNHEPFKSLHLMEDMDRTTEQLPAPMSQLKRTGT